MIDALYNWSLIVPDIVIIFGCALIFGLIGTSISRLSHRVWFSKVSISAEHEKKLADGVHTSVLALVAFFMALVTSNELTSFGSARGQVKAESVEITRLDRDLINIGPTGEAARLTLRQYVDSVVNEEWHLLARRPQSLSASAGERLNDLWGEIRKLQQEVQTSNSSLSQDLVESLRKIEDARSSRLSASVNSIPDIVWLILIVLFVSACVLNGRNPFSRHSSYIAFIHMAAFGLIVALNIIIDNPFGGDTSISSERISKALHIKH